MARLGKKISDANKYHKGKDTEWASNKVNKGSNDRCPGCQKKYKDMTPGQFTRHEKVDFKECPDS